MSTIFQIKVGPVTNHPEIKIIYLSGELDESTLPQLDGAIGPICSNQENQIIIFDFKGLEFMSSKIIGYLSDIHNRMAEQNRRMMMTDYNETIKDIITLVGMDQIIECYDTLEQALTKI